MPSADVALTAAVAQFEAAGGCCRKALRLVCPDLLPFVPALLLLPFLVKLLNAFGNVLTAALTVLYCGTGSDDCSAVDDDTVLLLLGEGRVLW